MAFMDSPFTHSRRNVVPFASSPREVEIAFQNVIGGVQIAWGVNELDRDDPSEFVDRWIGWFAAAVSGRLYEPSTLPERRDEKRWRER
jgi:serine/threonine-protein kinase